MACAVAITSVLGSTTVAFASVGGGSLLGFGRAPASGIGSVSAAQLDATNAAGVVHRTRNVYDEVVVGDRTAPSTPAALTATRAGALMPAPVPAVSAPPSAPAAEVTGRHHRSTTNSPGDNEGEGRRPPAAKKDPTPAPVQDGPTTSTTSTTAPPVTTTTRPRGVPADWPPDKPIPPMPPGCRQPQLEDNGVWNCQDD